MGKVCNDKSCISYRDPHYVVNNTCSRSIAHISKLNPKLAFNAWLYYFPDKSFEFCIMELHSNKAVIPFELPAFLRIILLPAVQTKIDTQE